MSGAPTSRRRFIGATSVALSAPLAGLGATALPATDDASAIRALLHGHATRLGAAPDGFGAPDRIDIAAGGHTATATLPCLAETETVIGPDCPLVDMARQQGGGVLRRQERGVLAARVVKRHGTWVVERAEFRPGAAEPAGPVRE